MNHGRLVFAQLLDFLPDREFRRIVARYDGNHRTRTFSSWDQLVCLAFGQLTFRESLRDLETCLRSRPEHLYHLGLRGKVCRSTLADANERRDWRIFSDLAAILISRARELYLDDSFGVELGTATAYAFDSTIIELSLGLFPWARFSPTTSAVKMNTLLDLRGSIPAFITINKASRHDLHGLDDLVFDPGAFYIFDRGYIDYARLHRLTAAGAFFVIRAKSNLKFHRLHSTPVDRTSGLRCDQIITLAGLRPGQAYPDKLRRVGFYDEKHRRKLVFLTNNFTLAAQTIADLYKSRWQIELFFKWIKGHLHLRRFWGNSLNAVKTQIWIAMSVYLLMAIAKKQLRIELSLHSIHQILSLNAFEKEPLHQLLTKDYTPFSDNPLCNQLSFNDF